jgi:hypothetical protein
MNEISKVILFIVVLTFLILTVSIISQSKMSELFLEYRKSKNGKTYGIQELFKEPDIALELLAKLHDNMTSFIAKLNVKYPNDERVIRLVKGFKHVEIEETTEKVDDDNTSFTINKGEYMSLCLREYPNSNTNSNHKERPFHDYNSLCFVIIHEMAHIASVSEGHNFEFIENFKFLLKEAVNMGYYTPIDYSKNPFLYCGKIKVTNNPYY